MKNVLLLEKKGEERASLAASLNARGFRVIQAQDEEQAWAALASGLTVDLAIASVSDCNWPEVLSSIRKNRPHLPLIFLMDCGKDKPYPKNLFSGVSSLSHSLQWYRSNRHILQRELDRQIRIVLNTPPSLAA